MKAYVCVKQVPDTSTKIKLKPDGSAIDVAGVKWIVNPYDEFAIEEAVKLKEAGKFSQVVLVSVGPKSRVVEALRTGLAMGADEAIAVDAPDETDPNLTAELLAKAIASEGGADAVFTGKLAIDDNMGAVGQMVAAKLQIPHVGVVSRLSWEDSVTAEREIEGGSREIYAVSRPLLVTANKGLNTPRYASLPGIMKAKKKVIKEYTVAQLGLDAVTPKLRHVRFQLPAEKPAAKLIAGDAAAQVKELVHLLRNEARVI